MAGIRCGEGEASTDAVCPQDCQEWCASQEYLIGRSLQGRSPLLSVRNGACLRRSSLDKVCRDNPPLQGSWSSPARGGARLGVVCERVGARWAGRRGVSPR